ncbi:tetratricopeptide repeat protein [Entomomonas asaccharolytica]|uniref:Sel1 repeat family protein n=1 Tax=Entomomonas asaccharolytica TaxID=2785331 RepID=A0A974ND76_9GAMM|nr:tetratricopeptide repeat protein [Entomomonas asaccharolytica]QQP84541.1 sel1 repeat family protein [Entomomonas asaccharolytica]
MKVISTKPLSYLLLNLVIVCFTSTSYGNDNLSTDELMAKGEKNYYEQDYQQAMQWYLKATDKGNAYAMGNIGVMDEQGIGVEKDHQQTMQWFLKAADKGNVFAMFNLGVKYYNGYGVPKDISIAKEWFQISADLGDSEAKEALKRLQ